MNLGTPPHINLLFLLRPRFAALAHGRQVVETQMPQPGGTDLGPYWWNGVTTRALLSEASETVEQWTPNPAKASFTFSPAQRST